MAEIWEDMQVRCALTWQQQNNCSNSPRAGKISTRDGLSPEQGRIINGSIPCPALRSLMPRDKWYKWCLPFAMKLSLPLDCDMHGDSTDEHVHMGP
jgi:hypothetical protein